MRVCSVLSTRMEVTNSDQQIREMQTTDCLHHMRYGSNWMGSFGSSDDHPNTSIWYGNPQTSWVL